MPSRRIRPARPRDGRVHRLLPHSGAARARYRRDTAGGSGTRPHRRARQPARPEQHRGLDAWWAQVREPPAGLGHTRPFDYELERSGIAVLVDHGYDREAHLIWLSPLRWLRDSPMRPWPARSRSRVRPRLRPGPKRAVRPRLGHAAWLEDEMLRRSGACCPRATSRPRCAASAATTPRRWASGHLRRAPSCPARELGRRLSSGEVKGHHRRRHIAGELSAVTRDIGLVLVVPGSTTLKPVRRHRRSRHWAPCTGRVAGHDRHVLGLQI